MIELELSAIPDSEQDVRTLTALIQEFGARHNVKVHLRRETWGTVWTDLLTFASHGRGPDVSHIGGTWVSSLAMMNALRPFKPKEIAALGGDTAFMKATWYSSMLHGDDRLWAVPWTGYIYVICYRRDLFAQAGVDERNFMDNADVLAKAIERLSAVVEIPWLTPYIVPPYTDFLHVASSWVWAEGGDFIDEDGKRAIFDSPQAIQGLTNWLDTHRAMPDAYKQIGSYEAVDLFRAGRVGAVLTDIRVATTFLAGDETPLIRDNLGVRSISATPWTGGGSFVIWQYTMGYPEREQAAVELVKFLTQHESEMRWSHEVGSMPARNSVLQALFPEGHILHSATQQAAQYGNTYKNVSLWRRIESQLAQELGACVHDAYANPSMDTATILRNHMEPLARRLNLTLGN